MVLWDPTVVPVVDKGAWSASQACLIHSKEEEVLVIESITFKLVSKEFGSYVTNTS